jgi:hypothetical protein
MSRNTVLVVSRNVLKPPSTIALSRSSMGDEVQLLHNTHLVQFQGDLLAAEKLHTLTLIIFHNIALNT